MSNMSNMKKQKILDDKKFLRAAEEELLQDTHVVCNILDTDCIGVIKGFTSSTCEFTDDIILLVNLLYMEGANGSTVDLLANGRSKAATPITICCLLRPYEDPHGGKNLRVSQSEEYGKTVCIVALSPLIPPNFLFWGCSFGISLWARSVLENLEREHFTLKSAIRKNRHLK